MKLQSCNSYSFANNLIIQQDRSTISRISPIVWHVLFCANLRYWSHALCFETLIMVWDVRRHSRQSTNTVSTRNLVRSMHLFKNLNSKAKSKVLNVLRKWLLILKANNVIFNFQSVNSNSYFVKKFWSTTSRWAALLYGANVEPRLLFSLTHWLLVSVQMPSCQTVWASFSLIEFSIPIPSWGHGFLAGRMGGGGERLDCVDIAWRFQCLRIVSRKKSFAYQEKETHEQQEDCRQGGRRWRRNRGHYSRTNPFCLDHLVSGRRPLA